MHTDDFRDDLDPSRGQWKAIAEVALALLGIGQPTSRAGATEALVRLKRTRDRQLDPRKSQERDPVSG